MKIRLFFLLVLPSLGLVAQTTRPGTVCDADSCFRYFINPIPDTVNTICRGCSILNLWLNYGVDGYRDGSISGVYSDFDSTTIYGIALTADAPMPEGLFLHISTLDSNQQFTRLATIRHSDPYIRGQYMYHAEYSHRKSGPDSLLAPTYEYYFSQPIVIHGTYLAGFHTDSRYPPADDEPRRTYPLKVYSHFSSRTGAYYFVWYDTVYYTRVYSSAGGLFPIVKLPCPRLDRPYLGANVGGMAIFTWDTVDGATYQIGISQGDDSSYSFVHLSDTLRDGRYTYTGSLPEGWYNAHLRRSCTYCFSGADTSVWSRWSEGRRFYYTPDPAAIDPTDLQPPTFDLYPNPTTGLLNVEFGNLNFEGSYTNIFEFIVDIFFF